ncbi:sensor histidine kinase [Nocardioides flavus (ex Wang et al. 2016)]|nr:ATP-binding protein [Nocardioides flavus (ex Wang et al. 2016)]
MRRTAHHSAPADVTPQSDTSREHRELLHELRSTMAGLVSGSALLDNPDVSPEARQRLWESMRRELDRMDRLLSGRLGPSSEIDLDEALESILELQRLKGRHVEVRGASDVVCGRYDALAEVLNILVDNAATHGGVDHSVVEVVRRDEDTVDIRVSDEGRGIPAEQRDRIFDWGLRGEDSPGEGIGLNLAQRLMTEDGGTLRLAEHDGTGSSFVISLPAARRPVDDLAPGNRRAWTF